MNKIEALQVIFKVLPDNAPIICTTGMISREVFTLNDRANNFYMIGSMGYASSIGIGIALNKPDIPVFVFDGDGSALMNLGNFPLAGFLQLKNYYHIIFDNQVYSSTGGQKTITSDINLADIAKSSGYVSVNTISELSELERYFQNIISNNGPICVQINVESGNIKGIARVSHTPEKIKDQLRNSLI